MNRNSGPSLTYFLKGARLRDLQLLKANPAELDAVFREIAWEAVTGHPLSGVMDEDGDGWADEAEGSTEPDAE